LTPTRRLLDWLEGTDAAALNHAELEDELDRRGRELLRQMFQGQLDLRALREERAEEVKDADGVRHGAVDAEHTRPLGTIIGTVSVARLAYRHRGHANLYPADGHLNLPQEHHSHGLPQDLAVGDDDGAVHVPERPGFVCRHRTGGSQTSVVAGPASGSVVSTMASASACLCENLLVKRCRACLTATPAAAKPTDHCQSDEAAGTGSR
jgi:hypothetical protein